MIIIGNCVSNSELKESCTHIDSTEQLGLGNDSSLPTDIRDANYKPTLEARVLRT
jgi:hypothetical protein